MLPQRLPLDQMQTTWANALNPLIANPYLNGILLKNVSLVAGSNVVSHRLSRNLQGWNPTRIRSSATLYDQQDSNQNPQLTLILVASAPCVVDLWVF